MEEEGLASVDELQSWLIRQMGRFLHAHGRRLVGWDEIMQGGLSPDATVMSWRGPNTGFRRRLWDMMRFFRRFNTVISIFIKDAPEAHVLSWAGYTPLKKVYDFNPIPDTLSVEHVDTYWACRRISGPNTSRRSSRRSRCFWPRGLAIAETGWTPARREILCTVPDVCNRGRFPLTPSRIASLRSGAGGRRAG